MKFSSSQYDLFDEASGYREVPRPAFRRSKERATPIPDTWDKEEAVRRLEQTGRFRILRKLVPRLAVLVDTETTGLQHAKDEVIEIGAVAFTYDDEGVVGD